MKTITVSGASRYSRGKGRNRKDFAQVTFLTDEGSARRSNTAHPEFKPGYGYVGLNPDQWAIPLNAQYEQALAEANSNFYVAKATLTRLEEKMLEVESGSTELAETGMSAMDTVMFGDFKTKLTAHIKAAEDSVAISETAVGDASVRLSIVQRDLPLEVAFAGPGLTY